MRFWISVIIEVMASAHCSNCGAYIGQGQRGYLLVDLGEGTQLQDKVEITVTAVRCRNCMMSRFPESFPEP